MRAILVPVADRPECARALQAAFDVAARVGASVSGCHIRPHRYSEVSLSPEFAEATWRRKSTKKAPVAAQTLFKRVAEASGYELIGRPRATPGALWSERVGSPDRIMGIVGPVSDLIVVSRPKKAGSVADLFLKSALLETSTPVLMLPQAGRRRVGKRICIGWDQSPSAARAVSAAIPLLGQADEVTIVTCGAEDRAGPKASQLASYLASWGIRARRLHSPGRQVEPEIMDACQEAGADLLVAGAYSRNRWRERVFGGTTEFLVRKARIPVFMLHV